MPAVNACELVNMLTCVCVFVRYTNTHPASPHVSLFVCCMYTYTHTFDSVQVQALVKWSGFGHACNTWEPLRNIPAWFHRTPNDQDPKALSKDEQEGVHRAVGESSKKTLRGKRRRVSDSGEWLKTECARRESMRKESYILWPQQYSSSEEEEAGEQVYQVDEKERARAKERAEEAQAEEEKQQNEGLRILFAENSRSATEFLGESRDTG